MHPAALILLLACGGALAAAARSRSGLAQLLALLMLMLWLSAALLALLDGPDMRGLDWLPLADLPVAAAAFGAWDWMRSTQWAVCLVSLALRFPLHVLAFFGAVDWVAYAHAINALFFIALVAIAWKGGIADAVDYCRSRLRGDRLSLACDQCVAAVEPAP